MNKVHGIGRIMTSCCGLDLPMFNFGFYTSNNKSITCKKCIKIVKISDKKHSEITRLQKTLKGINK